MTTPRIAAIVTCHDQGRWLVEALESVERQTRPAAEIVVVDNQSPDIYTRQVLIGLQKNGTRVAHADGHGASAARNLGARLTSADYLVWLDGDDILEPGYFEAAAAQLDADASLDFVSCAMRAFGAANYIWNPSPPTFVEAISTGGVPHASTMVRRRLWETIGGFDEELPSFELLDFWASALERGARGIILEQPLLNYRVRPGSGYRRSIQPATYRARLQHLYTKHRTSVERHGFNLIDRKETFLHSQREYYQTLASRVASLEAELTRLRQEISDTTRSLEARGLSRVEWGDFQRAGPFSQYWGRDRGLSIDRHYIEAFLERHRADVRGRVLEVRDAIYTQRFGGNAVTTSDVVDVDPSNSLATIVADLRRAAEIPTATYDCVILTQTLHLVDDMTTVLAECARILRPGGVLLATVPSVIRVDDESGLDGDFWRLTEASARKLFAEVFPLDGFEVSVSGNVMACAAFLYGMSAEEMRPVDLERLDSSFPVVIAIRAVKPDAAKSGVVKSGGAHPAAILAYHRVAELTPDSHALCISPREFREQMAYLREHFCPIGLEDLVEAAAAGRIPERAVAVTLDDGYLDALSVVSPILVELGIPATFFVNSDRLDEPHERWWDILERLFLSGTTLPSLLNLHVAGQDVLKPTATAADRVEALEFLNRIAWPLDARGRADLIGAVLAWSGADCAPRATHRVLTGEEIRTLAHRPGHTIGAHTIHHLALTVQAAETRRTEVFENKRALEHLLDHPVRMFAYPYGEFDGATLNVVREAGFQSAVTVEAGLVSAGANRLLLPRCEVAPRHHGAFPQFMREIFGQSRQLTPA